MQLNMLPPGKLKPAEMAKIPDEEPKDLLHIQCFRSKEYEHYLTSKQYLMYKCHGRGQGKKNANATWQKEQKVSVYLLIQIKE
jgi:hypothetical protein